jgi:MFS family permease
MVSYGLITGDCVSKAVNIIRSFDFLITRLAGAGFGLVFTMTTVCVALHFDEYRSIALILAGTGINIGGFLYPFLGKYLMGVYGWRGAMLITSGIALNMFCAGALIRSLR